MIQVIHKSAMQFHLGSFQPRGISAAATSPTPRSVARRLNCEAAFLVSCISTRMPKELIYLLVSGDRGRIEGPRPRTSRSKENGRSVYTLESHTQLFYDVGKCHTGLWPYKLQYAPSLRLHVPLPLGIE